MLEIIREYSFDVNFETGKFKRTDGSEERIKLVQNDNESTKFKFNFEEEIADNTNVLVRIRQSTGYVKEYTMLIQNQEAEIILTNDILSESGSLTMSITLIGTDDEILTDTEYHSKIQVIASLEGNTEIPEQEKSVLVDLISQVNSLNQTASQLVEDTETAVTNSSTVLANAETALQNANTATQNANNATTNANAAAQNANNAVTELDNRLATKVDKVNGKELSTNDYDNTEKEKNETNRTEILRRALVTETGNKIELEIDNSTYILTAKLYDKNNNLISTSNSIDLPLETMIVNATYNNNTKKIVLTLQSGSTVEFSIADLIDGLVNETTFNETIEELEAENIKLKQRISDLENNELINTVSGESIDIDDSANAENRGIKVIGKSWQNTTTGKNLWEDYGDKEVSLDNDNLVISRKNNIYNFNGCFINSAVDDKVIDLMDFKKTNYGIYLNILPGEGITLQPGAYTISLNNIKGSVTGTYLNQIGLGINKTGETPSERIEISSTRNILEIKKITFTLEEETEVYLFFSYYTTEEKCMFKDFSFEIQMEKGSEATDFEPYTNGASPNPEYEQPIHNCSSSINFKATNKDETEEQNITFPLQEGQVLAQDDFLADDGIHHVRKQIVFDGTEIWRQNANHNNNIVFETNINYYAPNPKSDDTNTNTSLCTIAKYNWWYNYLKENTFKVFYNTIRIRINNEMTLEKWKAYLAEQYANGTPIIIEYELSEEAQKEAIEPYTEEQQKAWEQIKALRTYKNITHINSEDETKPTFEVTYVRDLQTVINNMQAQILS